FRTLRRLPSSTLFPYTTLFRSSGTLMRSQSTKLAPARTGMKVSFGFFKRYFFSDALNADLSFEFGPEEEEGDLFVFCDFRSLFTVVIREENKATIVNML